MDAPICRKCRSRLVRVDGHWEAPNTGSWCVEESSHEPHRPAAAAVVWMVDGEFRLENKDYFEAAEELAEFLEEKNVPCTVLYANDFEDRVSEERF